MAEGKEGLKQRPESSTGEQHRLSVTLPEMKDMKSMMGENERMMILKHQAKKKKFKCLDVIFHKYYE